MTGYSRFPSLKIAGAPLFAFLFACRIAQAYDGPDRPRQGEDKPPVGLISVDPAARLEAIEEVRRLNISSAASKLANMAAGDPYPEIRSAACLAIAAIRIASKIPMLREVAQKDPDEKVRFSAAVAIRELEYDESEAAAERAVDKTAVRPAKKSPDRRDKYKQPDLSLDQKQPETHVFAIGIGTMGGFGIASASFRGRIPTGDPYIPWVGIEAGSGWTPPSGYEITAGPIGTMNHSKDRWKIIPAVGSVLLYFHRMHYVPVRVGWDIGRGVFGIIGYGFEWLNVEGFFSWGVEAGITIQPAISKHVDKIADCDNGGICTAEELWPVVPYVRFSLHFYIV